MSGFFQRRPQLRVVVDFAVKCDPQRTGFIAHRLVAALDVNDAQPPLAEMRPLIVIKAEIIGASMADRLGHSAQDTNAAVGRLYSYKSSNAAHDKEWGITGPCLLSSFMRPMSDITASYRSHIMLI